MNPYLKLALDYIESHDLNALPNGRHEIDGTNVFVNIVDSELRTPAQAKFEVHNRYIDIQIPLSAAESFGLKPRTACTSPVGEFNDEKDCLLFTDPIVADEVCTIETRQPGEMIIFNPEDAHAPLIGEGSIHKAIFKVRVV